MDQEKVVKTTKVKIWGRMWGYRKPEAFDSQLVSKKRCC